ncbi:hypothetical protein CS022_14140 [Veronia nyctiphanis]|uniref:OmpR/PhoB-type domain-containing protein n=1 Tax=Veronia nyctiphanis TaxID=1278244 RepID=A0A4V1LST0_9GAMM|nr:winged helix-turn-helix domain-containing protein [Veronia nyctiphanis]RXJ72768.1 hypothetical protein CS022_14140 [Veronia nyctiphanis]
MEVLIVEDPVYQSHSLVGDLKEQKCKLTRTLSFRQALVAVRQNQFSLVVVDLSHCVKIPQKEIELLSKRSPSTLVVITSDQKETRYDALVNLGIKVVSQQDKLLSDKHFCFLFDDNTNASNELSPSCGKCLMDTPLPLSPTEQALLQYLYDRRNTTVSKRQLFGDVLKRDWKGVGRVIDVHISNIRRKLRNAGLDDKAIETLKGKGYCYVPTDSLVHQN